MLKKIQDYMPALKEKLMISPLKTPTILQMEVAECGATALGIILAYYGRFVPLEELRIACGVSRDGSKASNILKAARKYDLIADGAQGDIETLKELACPYIIHWSFNHFVIVEGMDNHRVYLNDPARGRRSVLYPEFNKAFTGIILLLTPGPAFKPGGIQKNIWQSLQSRLQNAKNDLIFLVLASIAVTIPGMIIPGFSKIFIDDILVKGLNNWLVLLLTGLLITAGLRAAMSWLQQTYLLRLEIKLILMGSAQFLQHVLRLPLLFFDQRYAGDVLERVEANDRIAILLSGDLNNSIVGLISMVFYAIIMCLYDWKLTFIGLTAAFLNFTVLYLVGQRLQDNSRRFLQERGKLRGIEINGIQMIETLKAMTLEDRFFKTWAGFHAKTINSQQQLALYGQLLQTLPALFTGLTNIIILGFGSYQIIQGHISVGTLVAFQSLLLMFNSPLAGLLGVGSKLQEIQGDIARLDDALVQSEDSRYAISDTSLKKNEEKSSPHRVGLEFKNVSFGYSPLEPPIIKNFNLTLKPGGRVAIVGATGSGKSTLAKLACGLYQPWEGNILIADKPLQTISPERLSQLLSFVDQDIFLFEGNITDNLTLWDKTPPLADLKRAAQDAEIASVIQNRPNNFESPVLEKGANFSGGERQCLDIARALVKKPAILVLDEATASLDAITEYNIMNNLKKRDYSLIIIAHRLSAIRDCDTIIVLDAGKIVEQGTHDELLQKNEYYSRLIEGRQRNEKK